jgi:hypothetical protein
MESSCIVKIKATTRALDQILKSIHQNYHVVSFRRWPVPVMQRKVNAELRVSGTMVLVRVPMMRVL